MRVRTALELLQHYQQQHPDTPATVADLAALLHSLLDPSAIREIMNLDGMPSSLIINEQLLADWIGDSISTIQKWRTKKEGPKYVKKVGSIGYRVGDVRDWLEERTVKSTDESFARLGR